MEINQENIEKFVEKIKKERSNLGKVIDPIFNNFELEKKEILEVCQIGKFVYKIDTEIEIIDKPKPPNPDFIINYQKELIGLEHTQILTEDSSRYYKIKTLFDYAENIFSKKYPNINIHATISIKNDELNFKQSEKALLAKKIADIVRFSMLGAEMELPEFITRLRTAKHSQVTFTYNERKWQGPYLSKERLKQEIVKKEKKISGYKTSKKQLSQFWLVLLVGSLSSVSYQLNEKLDYSISSKFNRVYLMSDFEAKIIRIN